MDQSVHPRFSTRVCDNKSHFFFDLNNFVLGLLEAVLFAHIRFHDTVSRGRLLNRFGKDFEGCLMALGLLCCDINTPLLRH